MSGLSGIARFGTGPAVKPNHLGKNKGYQGFPRAAQRGAEARGRPITHPQTAQFPHLHTTGDKPIRMGYRPARKAGDAGSTRLDRPVRSKSWEDTLWEDKPARKPRPSRPDDSSRRYVVAYEFRAERTSARFFWGAGFASLPSRTARIEARSGEPTDPRAERRSSAKGVSS